MAQDLVTQGENRSDDVDDNELEENLKKTINGFLRGYGTGDDHDKSSRVDILENTFKIDLNLPLADFSFESAKAYGATNIKTDESDYFALVCEPDSIPRTDIAFPLINSPHNNITVLVSHGIVELSRTGDERMVFLYRKPKGTKLSKLISASKSPPSVDFICSYIIYPLAAAIEHLNSNIGVTHGLINCDNIYFDTSENTVGAVLGPCITESSGLSQPFYYESIERMQALPAGKGNGSGAQDYYALAVVVLHIIYGMNHFDGLTKEQLIRNILKAGAFDALARNKDMNEIFYDFFRGMLSYSTHDRWNYRYLKAWLDGKRYNVMPTPPPHEAIRPFDFEDGHAYTRKEVAHLFFRHWKSVPEVFIDGTLSSWVVISLRNKELNEYLNSVSKIIIGNNRNKDSYIDEHIMRVISVFDPFGPVRLKNLSFHMDGINSLLANSVLKGVESDQNLIMKFIELSMFNFIVDQKNKYIDKYEENEKYSIDTAVTRLEKLRGIIRNNGLGFGVERIFYDLNPRTKCISPLLKGKYVSTLPILLRTLDRMAPQLYNNSDPIDRHIAAFVASHLSIQHELHITSLDDQPSLAKSNVMIALKMMALAQHRARINHLPGLTNWFAIRILPLLDVIRSRTLKRKLVVMLANAARSGSLQKMEEVLISSGYAHAESVAFEQAVRTFKKNAADIEYYTKKEMIGIHSKQLGAKMAHYVAIAALIISFIISIRGGI
ncbi:MAG: hypothetical protein R3D71_08015 [Rickettsiales bacterium]